MESKLMQISIFLEELKMKRAQVTQLDSEMSRLNLRLIERESEFHAKTAQCQQLELKLIKSKQDVKQATDDFSNRMKTFQLESARQEAAILDYAEKLRKVQIEKQCLSLKIAYFEKEIKEMYGHVRNVIDSLPKINQQQENLLKIFQAVEAKHIKLVEACESIQIHVARIQKEAEEKWKSAQDMLLNRNELENSLLNYQAKLRLFDGGKMSEDTSNVTLKQNETILAELELSRKREEKLRLDLQREREAKRDLELKHEQVLNQLANYLSMEQKEPISHTVSPRE